MVWKASALVCSSAARPVMAAAMCGTMPSVQPKAATTLARAPRERPVAMRIEHPDARRGDDDQRGDQEIDAHHADSSSTTLPWPPSAQMLTIAR